MPAHFYTYLLRNGASKVAVGDNGTGNRQLWVDPFSENSYCFIEMDQSAKLESTWLNHDTDMAGSGKAVY